MEPKISTQPMPKKELIPQVDRNRRHPADRNSTQSELLSDVSRHRDAGLTRGSFSFHAKNSRDEIV
jgi:hypothetical protein